MLIKFSSAPEHRSVQFHSAKSEQIDRSAPLDSARNVVEFRFNV
jgi:hypothetical protein